MSAPHMDPKKEPQRETQGVWTGQGRYLGYGFTFAGATFLSFFLGLWADGKFGTTPFLTVGGALAGAAAGFYNLYAHLVADGEVGEADSGLDSGS